MDTNFLKNDTSAIERSRLSQSSHSYRDHTEHNHLISEKWRILHLIKMRACLIKTCWNTYTIIFRDSCQTWCQSKIIRLVTHEHNNLILHALELRRVRIRRNCPDGTPRLLTVTLFPRRSPVREVCLKKKLLRNPTTGAKEMRATLLVTQSWIDPEGSVGKLCCTKAQITLSNTQHHTFRINLGRNLWTP